MVFSSAIFLFVFLPIVCALYFIVPGIKGKNTLLIIAKPNILCIWRTNICIINDWFNNS